MFQERSRTAYRWKRVKADRAGEQGSQKWWTGQSAGIEQGYTQEKGKSIDEQFRFFLPFHHSLFDLV